MKRYIHTGNSQHAGSRLIHRSEVFRQVDMRDIGCSVRIIQKLRRKTAQGIIYPVTGSRDQHTAVLNPVHDCCRLRSRKIAELIIIDHQHIKKA